MQAQRQFNLEIEQADYDMKLWRYVCCKQETVQCSPMPQAGVARVAACMRGCGVRMQFWISGCLPNQDAAPPLAVSSL